MRPGDLMPVDPPEPPLPGEDPPTPDDPTVCGCGDHRCEVCFPPTCA